MYLQVLARDSQQGVSKKIFLHFDARGKKRCEWWQRTPVIFFSDFSDDTLGSRIEDKGIFAVGRQQA